MKPQGSVSKYTKKRRYANRLFQQMDLVDRFESKSSSEHVRTALGAIERVKDEGVSILGDGTEELARWQRSCDDLWMFLNSGLGMRRFRDKQDLTVALREFIQEFEHSTERMRQLLYGIADDSDYKEKLDQMECWFHLIYRFSTYGIISFWIDDKTEENSVKTSVNITTGKTTQDWTRKEMKVPRQFRHTTKKL